MNRLEITLKQHTPLIHFQHGQEGATLRASEVKPKLDRFILEDLGNGDSEKGKQIAKSNGWTINGQESALDYRMRIWTNENDIHNEYLIASYIKDEDTKKLQDRNINFINKSPYFAQEEFNKKIIRKTMNWNSIDKKGILHDKIFLEIKSFDTFLMEKLKKNLQSFFLSVNFGTRQSKGFGSFEVMKILLDNKEIPLDNSIELIKKLFTFVYVKQLKTHDFNTIFSQINNDYKLLKSGQTRPYAKSKLMLYGLRLMPEIRWEKRFIKRKVDNMYETAEKDVYYKLKKKNADTPKENDNSKYNYLRALLGLAEQFEFLLENPSQNDARNKLIVKVKSTTIQRIKSPILFKVLNSTIYLVGNEIPSDILGKEFSFTVSIQNDNEWQNKEIEESLFIPKNFSLCEFMRFAMNDATNNARLNYRMIK
jgi:hypothetical protein